MPTADGNAQGHLDMPVHVLLHSLPQHTRERHPDRRGDGAGGGPAA